MASEQDGVKDTAQAALTIAPNDENALRVLANQITDLHDSEVIKIERGDEDDASILILPQGRRAVDLLPFLEAQREFPKRIRGRARLAAPESFIDHVLRFKTEATAIFADVLTEKPKLLARYDYHEPGKAAWQEHTAQYDFPISPEWKAWVAHDGPTNIMSMEAFAFFLEQRVIDVLHPTGVNDKLVNQIAELLQIEWASPQALLQLSKSLHINTDSKISEVTDIQGGKKNFSFVEVDTDAAGKPLQLPGGFLIRVSVFDGSTPWVIPVLLRYRKQPGGKASFFYEIYRRDMHVLESMRETCTNIQEKTGVQLFYGRPEASVSGFQAKSEPE